MDLLLLASMAMIGLLIIYKTGVRLQLSAAKHPSIKGHSKWSRRIANIIPFFDYDACHYFCTDGAPKHIAEKRKQGFERLSHAIEKQSPKTLKQSAALENSISDVRFTSQYRIPYPFRTLLPKAFKLGSIIEQSQGNKIKDLDGNWRYDVSGSYGVNVFGYEFYKECLEQGYKTASELGPVLGAYHPVIEENVKKIKRASGLDEISFHMSGTEAVMQAVRLARYHTGRSHLVRLCGAYHGWWDGVQPGVGNKRDVNDVYTLNDLSDKTLTILKTRKDIACVLINPMQAFHPNGDSPSDNMLIASDRNTDFNKEHYTNWLKKIRAICSEKNIVLIFDEVFTGFRLGHRGAQGYFDIQADMVTYGKTLGGGLPIGVVAGTHALMKRFKDHRPADVSFARGTFNSHPYVMTSMNAFLNKIERPEYQTLYLNQEAIWNQRVKAFNQALEAEELPIKISNMHSVLSVLFTQASRYNWVFQFYLRNAGLELSWIGSGRMIMSFDFTDEDFKQVMKCFINAARDMEDDGWWWESHKLTNKNIKRQFLVDMLSAKFPLLSKVLVSPLKNNRIQTQADSNTQSTPQNLSSTNVKKAS